MPLDNTERRRAVRRIPQPAEALSRVRLRTGRELTVVDISSVGVFLEGLTRLLPNTHTDIHIVTRHGRVLVRARVVRALVWRLGRDVVCYRTALAFDTALDTDASVPPNERSESGTPALSERGESSGSALSERSESKGIPFPAKTPGISKLWAIATRIPQSETLSELRNAAYLHSRNLHCRGIDFGMWLSALYRVGGGGGGE